MFGQFRPPPAPGELGAPSPGSLVQGRHPHSPARGPGGLDFGLGRWSREQPCGLEPVRGEGGGTEGEGSPGSVRGAAAARFARRAGWGAGSRVLRAGGPPSASAPDIRAWESRAELGAAASLGRVAERGGRELLRRGAAWRLSWSAAATLAPSTGLDDSSYSAKSVHCANTITRLKMRVPPLRL